MDTRAALYARLSRDRSGEETATTRQLEDCRAFAAARGWTIVGEYTDADVSAYKRNVIRPGYDAMLAELDAGRVDVVVAWKLDRLLRRVMDFEKLWERCEPHGANIATVRDGIDTSAPMVGELMPRLMATFAQLESKNLSVREIRKHEETAKKGGRSGGGTRPFGLSADWSELVEPEAAMIREAVARILSGASMYAIARDWDDAGSRTPTGKVWTGQLLASMLRAPRIAGLREHRGAIVKAEDGKPVRATWPAILDPAEHERLRAVLAAHRKPGRPGRYLLSGLVACGRCGSTMRGSRRHGDRTRYYACAKTNGGTACGGTFIVSEPLEARAAEVFLEALDSPAWSAEWHRAESDDASAADLSALRTDELALEQLARDHYVDRLIGRPEFLAARDALHDRVEAARTSLAQSAGATGHDGRGGAELRAEWETGDVDTRRKLLGTYVDRVKIGPGVPGATRFDPDRLEVVWRA